MDNQEQQNNESVLVDKNIKRRTFVKKVTAGVVVTALPAKSVWGACNASGVSGGSQSTTSCEMPILNNGCSPDSWAMFVDYDVTTWAHKNKLKQMFSIYSRASNSTLKSKCKDLKKYIKGLPLVKLENGSPKVYLNVFEALEDKKDLSNLASCYLNAVFRFYNLPLQFSNADELVEHIYGVVKFGGASNYGMARMSFSTQDFGGVLSSSFNGGSTSVAIPD